MEVLRDTSEKVTRVGDFVDYSDNLMLIKNRYIGPGLYLADNTLIHSGNIIGNLHLNPLLYQEHSDIAHARKFVREAVRGLFNLADDCESNESQVQGIVAFHGISDVIKPPFAKSIGLPDSSLSLYKNQSRMKSKIANFRQEYWDSAYEDHQVKDIYELWLSRNELASLTSNFEELLSRL
jgi:hypothetical protein